MAPNCSTSSISSTISASSQSLRDGEKILIRFSFGGTFYMADSERWKYTGGQSYLESIPRDWGYSDLIFRLSEKVQHAVSLKYQVPGEDLDPDSLISVCDNSDLQEMFDEYQRGRELNQQPHRHFRIRVFLFPAEEELFTADELEARSLHASSRDLSAKLPNCSGERRGSGGSHAVDEGSDLRLAAALHSTARRSSWGSFSSAVSSGSQHSKGSTARGCKAPLLIHGAPGPWAQNSAEAAAWEEGFRAGQEAQSFAEECLWQELLLAKLSRAAKHISFTDLVVGDAAGAPLRMEVEGTAAGLTDSDWQNMAAAGFDSAWHPQTGEITSLQAADGAGDAWSPWEQDGLHTPGPGPMDEGGGLQEPPLSPMDDGDGPSPRAGPHTQEARRERQAVDLPNLGSDLGVGSGSRGLKLPSKLGMDLGNDQSAIDATEERPRQRGHQEAPSPSSPSFMSRQWSGNSSGRTVHHVPQDEVKVLYKIGEGAFGEVSLATIPIFGKVAVKWLKPGKIGTHNTAFWQEAELLSSLNHPHVIRFFGVVVESPASQQVVGIITEYMAGGSLSALLQSPAHQPRLSLRRRAELALGAANGMSYLHELRIVHFDLKPDNLLVDGDINSATVVKVADFGLSKHKYNAYVSGCRDLRGTLPYMAPELVSDPDHVSEKADVWSMGIVMWELAARQVPYANLSPQQIVAGLMQGYLKPEIPDWVEDNWRHLMESCLQTNPQARPTFRELSARLERIRDEAAFMYT
mmetsp:Transcript_38013/g.90296  ORF Transcript_38013/g.90296 Transcript_38013/m.90296 type:complete len:747 (-) Transcript_38013:278-2518(-)